MKCTHVHYRSHTLVEGCITYKQCVLCTYVQTGSVCVLLERGVIPAREGKVVYHLGEADVVDVIASSNLYPKLEVDNGKFKCVDQS